MDNDKMDKLNEAIYDSMKALRNDSVAAGMRGALGAVLGIINDKSIKTEYQKLRKIELFCKKAMEYKSTNEKE